MDSSTGIHLAICSLFCYVLNWLLNWLPLENFILMVHTFYYWISYRRFAFSNYRRALSIWLYSHGKLTVSDIVRFSHLVLFKKLILVKLSISIHLSHHKTQPKFPSAPHYGIILTRSCKVSVFTVIIFISSLFAECCCPQTQHSPLCVIHIVFQLPYLMFVSWLYLFHDKLLSFFGFSCLRSFSSW